MAVPACSAIFYLYHSLSDVTGVEFSIGIRGHVHLV